MNRENNGTFSCIPLWVMVTTYVHGKMVDCYESVE